MTSHAQRIFFLALTSMAGASALQAQQTDAPPINQTPPELRDFRLDPPAPAAQGPEQRPPLPSERPATARPVAQPPASQLGPNEPATGTARRETADPAPASRERDIETTANRNARGAPSADDGASGPHDSATNFGATVSRDRALDGRNRRMVAVDRWRPCTANSLDRHSCVRAPPKQVCATFVITQSWQQSSATGRTRAPACTCTAATTCPLLGSPFGQLHSRKRTAQYCQPDGDGDIEDSQ